MITFLSIVSSYLKMGEPFAVAVISFIEISDTFSFSASMFILRISGVRGSPGLAAVLKV